MGFIRSWPYVLEFTRCYKGSILMDFTNWGYIFFLMIRNRRLIIYLNYNFIQILFFHNIGIKEEARGFSMGSYMVFGRIMNHKRRLEIRNLLARDHSNILFHHGTHKCFLRRFQGNLLWDWEIVKLISLMALTWRRAYILWGLENSGYHYTQFRQLKGAFLYIF